MSNSRQDSSSSQFSRRYGLKRCFPRHGILAAAAACFWAAALNPAPTWAAVLGGTINAKVTVNFVTAPPAGSTVSCGLALISNDSHAPNDSLSQTATVSGATAVCSFLMHYKWVLASTSSTLTIAYSVSGPVQTSSALYTTIPIPPNGTTIPVTIVVIQ